MQTTSEERRLFLCAALVIITVFCRCTQMQPPGIQPALASDTSIVDPLEEMALYQDSLYDDSVHTLK